jgi:hypothetical protein
MSGNFGTTAWDAPQGMLKPQAFLHAQADGKSKPLEEPLEATLRPDSRLINEKHSGTQTKEKL